MGRKATVPYGLYRAHGFVSPALAQGTGFTGADLELLFEALENMFEHDRSAARGLMSTQALVIFEHDSALGNAPAHALFDKVKIETLRTPARTFADHKVTVDGKPLVGVRADFKVTSTGKDFAAEPVAGG
jgi:CRISPR-associated protein Csd2